MDEKEKTQTQKFQKWLVEKYPKNVRVSSTDRKHGKNHKEGNAVDVVGVETLDKDSQKLVMQTAISMGLRVGNELQGRADKKVDGFTGPHYHFDKTKFTKDGKDLGLIHFRRGGETGKARRSKRNKRENILNDKFSKEMKVLETELRNQGPSDSDRPEVEQLNVADIRKQDDSNTITNTLDSIKNDAVKEPVDFERLMTGLSNIESEDRFTGNNVKAVIDNKPEDYIPQITSETPILADTGTQEVTQQSTREPVTQPDSIGTPISSKSQIDWGAKAQEVDEALFNLDELTLEGMGNDLTNNFIDRNAVGFVAENIIEATETSGKFDPDFNAVEDVLYPELTEGLDNEDIEDILENSKNRSDFITMASLKQARVKRTEEMQKYASEHPVLSGTNTVGNILSEGAVFMPVASLAAAGLGATRIKKVNDLYKASRVAKFAVGEVLEQGIQEVIWSQNAKDYEFSPLLFASAIGIGVGLKSIVGSVEADEAFRKFLKDENGFINIATKEGKKLVDEVTEKVGTEQAIAFAESITKRKVYAANSIRKGLVARKASYVKRLNKLDKQLKSAPKGSDVFKKVRGQKQKLVRQIDKFDKELPHQLESLATGTHPKLSAAVDPKFKLSKVAEELGIDKNLVNTPKKARQYLGLDAQDINPDFVFEGEKAYEGVARKQLVEMADNMRLNMNESMRYAAGTDTVKSLDSLPILGKLQIGDKLNALAETDGPMSRMLFNKGNLVSSKNPLTSAYYNWLAPDGMGRQGMSKIRAIESQQKYAGIYGGDLMNTYHTHGDKIYKIVEGDSISKKAKSVFNADSYEDTIGPILEERVLAAADSKAFRAKYGNDIADIADDYYSDFNKINSNIHKRAKELGVEGVDFDAEEGWFHRSWDFREARTVDKDVLSDTVYRAMKSHNKRLGIDITDEDLLKHSKKFAYGLQNADISVHEALATDHINLLTKMVKGAGDGADTKLVRNKIKDLKMLKAKADAGDLANRVQMDVDTLLPDGRKLSDLFEKNMVASQKKYTARMSARIAAAEHGIKNIDTLDDWIEDAVALEVKSLAKKGHKNPLSAVKNMKESMKQDLSSFKHGGMSGLHGLEDDTAEDWLRMVKKYNFARLMQYNGISSMTELGKTFVEAGVANTVDGLGRTMRGHFEDLFTDNPEKYVDRLYDELRTITGVGMEDYAFSSKGMSKAARITDEGSTFNKFEKGLDVLGRAAQLPFGGIETTMRRGTANALAIKWANHFQETEKGGLISAFFGSNGVSNRVLENSGFGKIVDNKHIPNQLYKNIKRDIAKFASFDNKGRLTQLNLHKWDVETKFGFGDALEMQAHHIMVTPDATTLALWQSTPVGQILNQFRSFTINATTKVMGATLANAAISSSRGDQAEMIKGLQSIFWGTAIGTMSVALRQGIQRAGGDKEVDLFDEGLIKAAGIGFARSSVAGNIPMLIDSVSGAFGINPLFEKSSSMGRSKSFFNLETTPTGQAFSGVYKSGETALQGDLKGASMKLLKASPIYRQLGAQQLFNFIDKEK